MSEESSMVQQPGPEHGRLEPFAGTFRAEVKIWMGPGDPMVSTGKMVNEMDLGGRFLRQSYKGDPSEGPFPNFEGRGFWGFNSVTRKYEGFWIDTASTMMQTEMGDLDEASNVWIMSGQMPDPQSGQMITKRSVITLQDNDHHRMEMFFVQGGQEFKGMEITYERAR